VAGKTSVTTPTCPARVNPPMLAALPTSGGVLAGPNFQGAAGGDHRCHLAFSFCLINYIYYTIGQKVVKRIYAA
jgi:hypothetical protein